MPQDLRVAARALRKNPVFSLTAVAVLALGIGANSAIFGLVNEALFPPPGLADPSRIVAVRASYRKLNMPSISVSDPDFRDVRDAREVDVWLPLALARAELTDDYRSNGHLLGVARLRPGVTRAAADARIGVLAARVRGGTGDNGALARSSEWGMSVMPFTEYVAGDSRLPMLVLLGAVGFVLLMACANIAGLMLARTSSRNREIAVRAALGAGRWRLVRQTMAESLLLSGAGALLGLVVAARACG